MTGSVVCCAVKSIQREYADMEAILEYGGLSLYIRKSKLGAYLEWIVKGWSKYLQWRPFSIAPLPYPLDGVGEGCY